MEKRITDSFVRESDGRWLTEAGGGLSNGLLSMRWMVAKNFRDLKIALRPSRNSPDHQCQNKSACECALQEETTRCPRFQKSDKMRQMAQTTLDKAKDAMSIAHEINQPRTAEAPQTVGR
jgi:hypothetical protein